MSDILKFYLLNPEKEIGRMMEQVTALDTYRGATKEFHENGLYSTRIFGMIGSEQRDSTFAFMDLRLPIISPIYAMALYDLKHLYRDIMAGTRYATWDPKLKDFFAADVTDPGAGTGYHFFVSRLHELTPAKNKSLQRQQNIDIVEKYRDIALSRYVLVYPAGLRDIETSQDGRETEPEVNKLYRKLLTTAGLVPPRSKADPAFDNTRWAMQKTFNEIFELFFNMLEGKHGYVRGKVAARNIFNGTRNVISPMDTSGRVMDGPDDIRPTDATMGLFQVYKGLLPVGIHAVRTKYLSQIDAGDGRLYLIDKKTLKRSAVYVSSEDYDRVTSDEGIERLINSFSVNKRRNLPVLIANHYIALIYRDDVSFKVFYDIEDLPQGYSRNNVSPMTLAELLYCSMYDVAVRHYAILTRFPVAGEGSTFPGTIRLTTTRTSFSLWELEDDWTTRKEVIAAEYPNTKEEEYFSSIGVHAGRAPGQQADFDGDTESSDMLYTEEALEENAKKLTEAAYWVSDGAFTIDVGVDQIERTLVILLADEE